MSIVDDFLKGYDFIFMDKKSGLEDKLSNQNYPWEDFLKDDDAVKTTLYMGANTQKYLNSEKIKKLIKLITEEPKEDDQLHGHKFPFVASEILKLQCPFIAKRFVLNEKEYHEEFPHSSEEEIGDLDFDLEEKNDNENNNLEKKFEELYTEFKDNYKKIMEFKNIRKQEIKSKDDELKDESKNDNKDFNKFEEECEEYEENKEDNAIDDIEKDENDNENINKNDEINKNNNEKNDNENIINNNEEISDNNIKENLNGEINKEEKQNIENENNVENQNNNDNNNENNINNEETSEIKTEQKSEEEKQEKNNIDEIIDINKDNIEKQIKCDNNELKINKEKNNKINKLNNDLKENKEGIIEKVQNNKDIIEEKNGEKDMKDEEKKDIIKDNIKEDNLENKNNVEIKIKEKQNIIEENKEDNKKEITESESEKIEETKEENKVKIIKENKDETEIKEDNKNEIREEIKEETKKEIKEEIKEERKDESKNENKEETKEENKDEVKKEDKNELKEETKDDSKKETKEEIKEENKEETKEETQNETKKEINVETINETKEESKEENKNEIKEEILEEPKKETKELIKEEIKDENKGEDKEDIKEVNKEEIKDEDKKEIKIENKEKIKDENKKEENENIDSNNLNNNNEKLKTEEKKREEKIQVKDQEKIIDIPKENINSESQKESDENNEEQKLENKIDEENIKNEENEINDKKKEIQEQNIIEDDSENKEEQEKKPENEFKEKDIEINQEEETNEEINNIIIDKADEEKDNVKDNKEENINNDFENIENNIDNDNEDVKSLSVEGELDEEESNKKLKKKKVYKDSQNNEYFDLLLNFVMTDKPELNYVLSGYFANVILSLVGTYPHKVLKYLYTQRRDALKNILFHSNQKAMAILASKLLNIESYVKLSSENNINDFIVDNIPYRNELIKEILTSINLDGFIPYLNQNKQIDIEGIFSLISGLISECKILTKELLYNNLLCPHLFDILETNLYADIDNKDNFNEDNFNTRYNIYGLFIDLTSKFLKTIQTEYSSFLPMDFDFQNLMKPKTDLQFNDNIIITFGKILQNNFLAKKPPLILESMSSVKYEGLGSLNLRIFELVKTMFYFMKGLPNQFDLLLIRNKFCERSIEYFFKYQWNNIYQNKFTNFFSLYLEEEERHPELTNFYFNHIKLQDLLLNFLQEIYPEKNKNIITEKNYEFKSGKKIKSGIYSHVIDLMYKIQAISGLDVFTEDEKNQFGIKSLGIFEFSKDEKSLNTVKVLKISDNLKSIFSKDEKWNSVFKSQVLPVLRKYEGQLCKKPKIVDDEDDSEIRSDYSSLLQKMLNVLKKNPSKHYVLPISRNDKSWNTNVLNKGTNEKMSIRSKLLNKGYRSRHIFDDDDDDDEKKDKGNNNDKEKKEEEINENNEENEKDKMFYDSNYWEMKNDLPEKIKKEVDKKTNIIFNYNPITGENEKKNEISEEDELLSIAMGLEQNEKLEKNKKVMYIMPGRIKPINLKTKSNPVQNIFININKPNNNYKYENTRNKKKDIINFFDNNDNENEEQEKEEEIAIEKKDDKDVKEDKEDKMLYDESNPQENTDFDDDKNTDNKKENDNDEEKFNDVNYWKSNDNYLNEEEMKELINDL